MESGGSGQTIKQKNTILTKLAADDVGSKRAVMGGWNWTGALFISLAFFHALTLLSLLSFNERLNHLEMIELRRDGLRDLRSDFEEENVAAVGGGSERNAKRVSRNLNLP